MPLPKNPNSFSLSQAAACWGPTFESCSTEIKELRDVFNLFFGDRFQSPLSPDAISILLPNDVAQQNMMISAS